MKTSCPICSGILLRHFTHSRILWFCPRCRQEMPNFDLVKLIIVRESFAQFDNYFNDSNSISWKNTIENNLLVIKQEYPAINLFVNTDKKRLEVVSFVLNKVNIMANSLTNPEQYIISEKSGLDRTKIQKNKKDTLSISIKTDFLKQIKIILLYICQAILLADSRILNSANLQQMKSKFINFKFPIEQSYFIDIIKNIVINFIHSITSDSERSVDYFASEVNSYFEVVITSMIQLS